MTGYTHAVGGTASLWLLYPMGLLANDPTTAILVVATTFGALLPDLDSKLNQLSVIRIQTPNHGDISPFGILTRIVTPRVEHRGILHSFVGWATMSLLMGIPLFLLTGPVVPLGFALGYLTHLALDCCTVRGLRVMWPSREVYFLVPKWLRIVGGKEEEGLYFVPFACATMGLLIKLLTTR